MRFLYPRACNWILHKRNRDGTYTLKDCLCGCEYTLGPTIGFLWRNYMFTMGDVARCSQYNEAKVGTEITEGENELWL